MEILKNQLSDKRCYTLRFGTNYQGVVNECDGRGVRWPRSHIWGCYEIGVAAANLKSVKHFLDIWTHSCTPGRLLHFGLTDATLC